MTISIVIPARYDSSRFPGKPLALIAGKPMIEWVTNTAKGSKLANKVIVATDDKRIFDFVKNNLDVDVELTSKDHKSGTDRIAEVVNKNPDIKYIVNLQGDEPLIPSYYIDKVLEPILWAKSIMATLGVEISSSAPDINNPNIVKATIDKDGFATSFRRYIGQQTTDNRQQNNPKSIQSSILSPQSYYRHLGIYAFTRETLLKFTSLPQSPLEKKEKLEQLRALENGIKIKLEIVSKVFPSVDIPEDIKKAEDLIKLAKK